MFMEFETQRPKDVYDITQIEVSRSRSKFMEFEGSVAWPIPVHSPCSDCDIAA
jgi:hypothetical protein